MRLASVQAVTAPPTPATATPPRWTVYPVTPTLSVDAVHDSDAVVGPVAVAVSPPGALGATVSLVPPLTATVAAWVLPAWSRARTSYVYPSPAATVASVYPVAVPGTVASSAASR